MCHRGLKIKEFFVYFDCVQLAIGWRGHVTIQMRECSTKSKQERTTFRKARQTQSGLNHGGVCIDSFLCDKMIVCPTFF